MSKLNLSGILEEMTTEDVKELNPNVGVIPIGSTEPHGPALPYGTDSFAVGAKTYEATRQANKNGARVICLPVQKISLNNNFYALPFACRMSVPVFMAMVKDLILFLKGENINRIIITNGHGGNIDVLKAVQRDVAGIKGLFVGLLPLGPGLPQSYADVENLIEHYSPHAGEWETSNMLFLKPNLVKKDKIGVNPMVDPKLSILEDCHVHFVKPWHLHLPTSAGGDARKSSADKADKIFQVGVKVWSELFLQLSKAPESETFPF